ncbi:hypothetical protein ABIA26_001765 [Sinorhizobium fredii]
MLATNRDPRRASGLYRRRWQIKCLFAETKTRGLNVEDTRLRQPNKLCLLRAVVARHHLCPTRRSPSANSATHRRKSTFRVGLDALRAWIQAPSHELTHLGHIIRNALKSKRTCSVIERAKVAVAL